MILVVGIVALVVCLVEDEDTLTWMRACVLECARALSNDTWCTLKRLLHVIVF